MKSEKMKKIFISILAASAIFAGCNNTLIEDTDTGYGELTLDLTASDEFEAVSKASETRAKLRNEDVNEFTIKMTRESDGLVKEYARFGDMPQMVQIPSGRWTLEVSSPQTLPAAFDQPVYGAKHEFDVKIGEVSSEKLVCIGTVFASPCTFGKHLIVKVVAIFKCTVCYHTFKIVLFTNFIYNIDVFVIGDDWKGKFDFLSDLCEVVYLPRTPDISTTQVKEHLGVM